MITEFRTGTKYTKIQNVICVCVCVCVCVCIYIYIYIYTPEGKRSLGRPRHRWEDNIKMDLQEVGGGGDWMELAQDRDRWRALLNTVMNLRVP